VNEANKADVDMMNAQMTKLQSQNRALRSELDKASQSVSDQALVEENMSLKAKLEQKEAALQEFSDPNSRAIVVIHW